MHKQMIINAGEVKIFDNNVVLNPLSTEVSLYTELKKTNQEKIIYYSAKKAGKEWFGNMINKYGMKAKDVMTWGPELIDLGGWGIVKPLEADMMKKEFTFELQKSTFARQYGKSTEAVDYYFRGFVTGAWSAITNTELEGIEIKCAAKGDATCKFLLKEKTKFDSKDPLVIKQL
ncbi:hypothetical protein HUU53_00150 [Candidatus Micrarchaeota archaeon]|nr:hypothetical protein [Candidatus Micrarchaeota archaeon]